MNRERSQRFFEEARRYIPGGVNSPVRAFASVNDTPFYVDHARGPYLVDVDGNTYLDYVASWGAIILGHGHDGLVREIQEAVERGTSFGACHPGEVRLAQMISEAIPSIEEVRLTSSGTEAVMSAIRLARGYTGRNGVVKFRGCYHGHVDSLLVKAGSGLATFAMPDSAGVPKDLARHTYIADFNHPDSLLSIISAESDLACVILEPVMGNMGLIPPAEGFLAQVQEVCREKGILLICDEVITGFRMAFGGAQGIFAIEPDLTCLGKIIGGGFPIGAFGGRRDIMEHLAPSGDVYQAGTLSGNPVAVRAGLYALRYLKEHPRIYDDMARRGTILRDQVSLIARHHSVPYVINSVTGMFTGFFVSGDGPVDDYESALRADRTLYERFFKAMLQEGLFFAPSQFETAFLTLAHGDEEIDKTVDAFERVFSGLVVS